MKITIAHSPDADDAFMFYALASGKIDTGSFTVEHQLKDIQTLNEWALEGKYEVTAISFHAYPYLQDKYALLTTGGSFGEKDYGPMVVKRPETVEIETIGVPGTRTTAFLLLQLWNPELEYKVIPFDQILDAVVEKEIDAGLIIHEGQLFFQDLGLQVVQNFGSWWYERYQLPLPLGGNAIRRDLPDDLKHKVAGWIKASIQYGLDHREKAVAYALQFGRGLSHARADEFVGMYVNERTLDLGKEGKKAVQLLLDLGYEKGLILNKARLDWVHR